MNTYTNFFSILLFAFLITQLSCSKEHTHSASSIIGNWSVDSIHDFMYDTTAIAEHNFADQSTNIAFTDTTDPYKMYGQVMRNFYTCNFTYINNSYIRIRDEWGTAAVRYDFENAFIAAMTDTSDVQVGLAGSRLTLTWTSGTKQMYLTKIP